jgi:hypothetical protein
MSDIIQLNALQFPIEFARIEGWLYDDAGGEVRWSINVRGVGREFGGESYRQVLSPRFYDEAMPLTIDDWRRLEGAGYDFDLKTDDDNSDSAPTLYVCSHLSLPRSELRIGERRDDRFALRWRGVAESNWGEPFGDEMPFAIDIDIPFAHQEVRFWQQDDDENFEAAARAIMARRGLSGEHLHYRNHRRFNDDPADRHYRLISAFFLPAG